VLSCCRPDMGWPSWKFEGVPHQSPHFLVYARTPGVSPGAALFSQKAVKPALRFVFLFVMAGLVPATHVLSLDPRIALGL